MRQWLWLCMAVCLCKSCASLSTPNAAAIAAVRVAASATSTASDVDSAKEACKLWEQVPLNALPDTVLVVASALKATSLARVGRDDDAEAVYATCLCHKKLLSERTLEDVIIGRAAALQRLMRYEEACTQYLVSMSDRATIGAITCCMRDNNLDGAITIVSQRARNAGAPVLGLLPILQLLHGKPSLSLEGTKQLELAAQESPMFVWLGRALNMPRSMSLDDFDLIELAAINQSPLDDPALIVLDDKVDLHNLLVRKSFWPRGFVMPDQLQSFGQEVGGASSEREWILKSRVGYGSHGNQIVSPNDILSMHHDGQQRLLQKLVEPPLLLRGRKFSLRIYVVCFVDHHYVLLEQGLVKLASELYQGEECNDDMHMTNSGRGADMIQLDLVMLKKELGGESYKVTWSNIQDAVQGTMDAYKEQIGKQIPMPYRNRLQRLAIPKILGFDFMLTQDFGAMLLEVNRFPGLEPRGDDDKSVKTTVIRQAWAYATDRIEKKDER